MIAYPFATCKAVVLIPWPKDAVASLHFPHTNFLGGATSSISNSILLNTPIFSKKDLSFSIPNFCPILTEPIFPDLIKISSTVKFGGILLSYSPMVCFPQRIFFSKFKNSVSVSINLSCNPAATVKVLNTEPNS